MIIICAKIFHGSGNFESYVRKGEQQNRSEELSISCDTRLNMKNKHRRSFNEQ